MTNDVEAIQHLLLQYATAIDARDWGLLRACFVDEATADYGDIGVWSSADELVHFMDLAHIGFGATKHMLTNFVIQVDGDTATASSYVHAVLTVADGSGSWIEFIGDHRDQLTRTASGWRLVRRVLRQTRLLAGDGNLAAPN